MFSTDIGFTQSPLPVIFDIFYFGFYPNLPEPPSSQKGMSGVSRSSIRSFDTPKTSSVLRDRSVLFKQSRFSSNDFNSL